MGVDVGGILGAATGMEASAASLPARAAAVTAAYATEARKLIQARAPRGPKAEDNPDKTPFADSFAVETGTWRGFPSSEVGTNEVQGFRLELGFHGTDKAGRSVSQSPRPTVGPAADSLAEAFWASLATAVEEG